MPLNYFDRQALAMTVTDDGTHGYVESDYRVDDGIGFDNDAATVDAQEDDLGSMMMDDPYDSYPQMPVVRDLGEPTEFARLAALHDCACARTGLGGILGDLFGLGDGEPDTYDYGINVDKAIEKQYPGSSGSGGGGFWDFLTKNATSAAQTAANAGIKRLGQEISGGGQPLPRPKQSMIFGVPTIYVGVGAAALAVLFFMRRKRD